jgi:hypothetical protein
MAADAANVVKEVAKKVTKQRVFGSKINGMYKSQYIIECLRKMPQTKPQIWRAVSKVKDELKIKNITHLAKILDGLKIRERVKAAPHPFSNANFLYKMTASSFNNFDVPEEAKSLVTKLLDSVHEKITAVPLLTLVKFGKRKIKGKQNPPQKSINDLD